MKTSAPRCSRRSSAAAAARVGPLGLELGHPGVVAVLEADEEADRREHGHADHEPRRRAEPAVEGEPDAEEQQHGEGDVHASSERVVGPCCARGFVGESFIGVDDRSTAGGGACERMHKLPRRRASRNAIPSRGQVRAAPSRATIGRSTTTSAPRFRDLHRPGEPLVMPNAWDAGSAKLFESLGFAAIATTSSGFAATLGQPDGGVTPRRGDRPHRGARRGDGAAGERRPRGLLRRRPGRRRRDDRRGGRGRARPARPSRTYGRDRGDPIHEIGAGHATASPRPSRRPAARRRS